MWGYHQVFGCGFGSHRFDTCRWFHMVLTVAALVDDVNLGTGFLCSAFFLVEVIFGCLGTYVTG